MIADTGQMSYIHRLMLFVPTGTLLQGWHLSDSQSGKIQEKLQVLHRKVFAKTSFDTQRHLHKETFTQNSLCTQRFDTEKLLQTEVFTQLLFYTQTLLDTNEFTCRGFEHRGAFTHTHAHTHTTHTPHAHTTHTTHTHTHTTRTTRHTHARTAPHRTDARTPAPHRTDARTARTPARPPARPHARPPARTHARTHTHKPLRLTPSTEALTDTEQLWHTDAFRYTEPFARKRLYKKMFYTENLLQTPLLNLHRELFHAEAFTQRSIHTENYIHTEEALSQRNLYTQKLLHTEGLHTGIFTQTKLSHIETYS